MLAKMLSKGDELIAVVSDISAYVGTNDSTTNNNYMSTLAIEG
jgi:hypothetical protein